MLAGNAFSALAKLDALTAEPLPIILTVPWSTVRAPWANAPRNSAVTRTRWAVRPPKLEIPVLADTVERWTVTGAICPDWPATPTVLALVGNEIVLSLRVEPGCASATPIRPLPVAVDSVTAIRVACPPARSRPVRLSPPFVRSMPRSDALEAGSTSRRTFSLGPEVLRRRIVEPDPSPTSTTGLPAPAVNGPFA
jgi:hypothetical protein